MTAHPLAAPVRHWPPAQRELFEERAALREYLGNLPRPEAERLAEEDVRKGWR